MGATDILATFAANTSYESLPPDVVHAARRAILDCIGVGLAGAIEPVGQIIARQAERQGGATESTLWATGSRVGAQNAALANGTASHALDFDDTNHSMRGHPSVTVLPAVLAVGEALDASGADVLTAFAVGVEVECKLGWVVGQELYDRGWHPTRVHGTIGATAGVGWLVGLSLEQMRQAIGIAVSEAGGVRQNFGTMTKPLHVGRAAQAGVFAVELAQQGFTASETAIEGDFGYLDLFGYGAECDEQALAGMLGNPFDLVQPGINFKAYPCCASTHPAIDAALQVCEGLTDDAIREVVVDVPYTAPLILIHHRPTAPLAAKFSLEYCVAAALLDREVTLQHFTEEAVNRPDLQSLLRRVRYRVPDEWQKEAGPQEVDYARVEVHLNDGTVRCAETTVPKGNADNPLTDAELEAKFLTCAGLALGEERAAEALELIRSFDRLGSVRGLSEYLVTSAATPA